MTALTEKRPITDKTCSDIFRQLVLRQLCPEYRWLIMLPVLHAPAASVQPDLMDLQSDPGGCSCVSSVSQIGRPRALRHPFCVYFHLAQFDLAPTSSARRQRPYS